MAQSFKRKRKPDNPSVGLSLTEHIAMADPHPQYAFRNADGSIIQTPINIITNVNNNSNTNVPATSVTYFINNRVTAVDDKITTVNARIDDTNAHVTTVENSLEEYSARIATNATNIASLSNRVTTVTNDLTTLEGEVDANLRLINTNASDIVNIRTDINKHVAHFTQAQALSESTDAALITSHVDDTGRNLYAARTHSHEPVNLGAADRDHNHDLDYSDINHNHDNIYAPYVHRHQEYLYTSQLNAVGIYQYTVNDKGDTESVFDDETGETISSTTMYDFNEYTDQGMFYLAPGTGDVVLNNPPDDTTGYLNVQVVEVTPYEVGVTAGEYLIQQLFYGEYVVWRRRGTATLTDINEIGSLEATYDEWTTVGAGAPIGSLMYITGETIPAGYLSANGASILKSAYPVLWKYAKQSGTLIYGSAWDSNPGCYQQASGASTKTIASTDVGGYIVGDGSKLIELTSSNISSYTGQSKQFISATDIDTGSFRLPMLGGQFLRAWTDGQTIDGGRGLGSSQSDAMRNITGSVNGVTAGFSGYNGAFYSSGSTSGKSTNTGTGTSLGFDASRVTNTASENRPVNVAVQVVIKAYEGVIVPEDASMTEIREIIASLVQQYAYATTAQEGLIRLATQGEVNSGTNTLAAVTPSTLKGTLGTMVKTVRVRGTNQTITNHIVDLDVADALANRTVKLPLTGNQVITCTTQVDIATASNTYVDWIVPEAEALNIPRNSNGYYELDNISVNVMLKALSSANGLSYPTGAVIPNPLCVNKPNNDSEYLCHPQVVVYTDTFQSYSNASVGGTSNAFLLRVRLYWPLQWYAKSFPNDNNMGSKTIALTQLSAWSVVVKLKY